MLCVSSTYNHRMAWAGKDLKGQSLVSMSVVGDGC